MAKNVINDREKKISFAKVELNQTKSKINYNDAFCQKNTKN